MYTQTEVILMVRMMYAEENQIKGKIYAGWGIYEV